MAAQGTGPVLVSYRTSDGERLAAWCSASLRAHGVPAWHADEDLLAGGIPRELERLRHLGLSGAVLVVTDNVRLSGAVRNIEAPIVLALDKDPSFILMVGNAAASTKDGLDYAAPDELLGLERGTLASAVQMPLSSREDAAAIAQAVARLRAERLPQSDDLEIHIQTRLPPHSLHASGFSVRLVPPDAGASLPSVATIKDFQSFLGLLPELIERSRTKTVTATGGAHLGVAFCLGAAIPTTAPWQLRVLDQEGQSWTRGGVESPNPQVLTTEYGRQHLPVAAYVDAHPEPAAHDAFGEFLLANQDDYSGAIELRLRTRIEPGAGVSLAESLASQVRTFAAAHRDQGIHLFLRVPFPLAVLIGRHFNTFSVLIHEFELGTGYHPLATVETGMRGGPITAVAER